MRMITSTVVLNEITYKVLSGEVGTKVVLHECVEQMNSQPPHQDLKWNPPSGVTRAEPAVASAQILFQCALFSDPHSASAVHIGSTVWLFARTCSYILLPRWLSVFCLLCLKFNLLKKNLTASARDNSATGFPVLFLFLLSNFYIRG